MEKTISNKVALIVVADTHINSTVGLSPRIVNLDDGGTFHASRTQHWLWDCWTDFIAEAKVVTQDYKRVVIFGGDLTELDTQKRSIQLTTLNKSTILKMVQETIEPLVDIADACYFIRGTSAHTGKSSWSEEETARDTEGAVPEGKGVYSWWHYRGVAGGVRVDVAHHAQMGSTPWTKKNSANNLAARVMWHYTIDRGEKPPNLVLRSHNHCYASSGDNYAARVDYLPCWTTATEYSYRVGYENTVASIGGIIYKCENGYYTRDKVIFEPREDKHLWKLNM